MKKRLLAIFATLGFVAVGSLALASPASAVEDKPVFPVCSEWQMRGGAMNDDEQPAFEFGGKPAGASNDDLTAVLKKPTGDGAGVEFASTRIRGEKPSGVITVKVALKEGALPDAGAVRLFYYTSENANTLTDAPSGFVAATGDGMLQLPYSGGIGTLGLTYDASNPTTGSVAFAEMKIGDRPVRFNPCPPKAPEHKTSGPSCESKDMDVTITNVNEVWPVAIWIWVKGDPEPMRVAAGAKVEGTVTEATRYGWAFEVKGSHPKITEAKVNGTDRRVGLWTFVDVKYPTPDCATPPPATEPPASGGNAGGLPVTGAEAGKIAGVAGAIILVGAVLFVAARKRRIRTVA